MDFISLIKPVVFYSFSALAVGSAVMVIVLRNPLYSAVSLVLTFFSLSGIFVLLNSEIIAVFQVLVYAGAIMVLVIFVIMLLNLRKVSFTLKKSHIFRSVSAVILGIVLFVSLIFVLFPGAKSTVVEAKKGEITAAAIASEGSFQLFSRALFSEYLLPFELVSLLLTVAIVGVVILIRGMEENTTTNKKNKEDRK